MILKKIRSFELTKLLNVSSILVLISPFMRLMLFNRGILFWSFFLIIPLFIINIIKNKHNIFPNFYDKFTFLLFIFYLMISRIYSPNISNFFVFDQIKALLIAFLLFINIPHKDENFNLKYALLISGFAIILLYFLYGQFYLRGVRFWIVLPNGLAFDPNMVSASLIYPAIFATGMFFSSKNILKKLFFLFSISVILFFTLLSGSRGGLITIIFAISIKTFSFISFKSKNSFIYSLNLLIIIPLIIGLFIITPADIIERFSISEIVTTGASGRFNIITDQIKYLYQSSTFLSFFFGFGQGSSLLLTGNSSHNIFIEYFIESGVIGLFLFFLISINILKKGFLNKSLDSIILLICVIIWSLSISTNNQVLFWVLIYTSFSFSRNHTKIKKIDL